MKNNKTLASKISSARKEKGLSMRELARLSEMDHAEISRIEKGIRLKPNILFLKRLSENLDIELNELTKLAGYSDNDVIWEHGDNEIKVIANLRKELSELKLKYDKLMNVVSVTKKLHMKNQIKLNGLLTKLKSKKSLITIDFMVAELKNINTNTDEITLKYKEN